MKKKAAGGENFSRILPAVVAELVRVLVYQLKGRGFESRRRYSYLLFSQSSSSSSSHEVINAHDRARTRTRMLEFRFAHVHKPHLLVWRHTIAMTSWDKKAWKSKSMEWTDGCPLQLGNSSSIVFPQLWKDGMTLRWQLPILQGWGSSMPSQVEERTCSTIYTVNHLLSKHIYNLNVSSRDNKCV